MAPLHPRLALLFEERGIPFECLEHPPDFSSQRTAEHTHTPGEAFAKAVVLRIDGDYAMAVLPANRKVDLEKLRGQLDADEVFLASEEKMRDLFPDCELGAEPALGNLYGLPVYLSPRLVGHPLTFNGGTHEQAIRMGFDDFVRIAHPRVIDLEEA